MFRAYVYVLVAAVLIVIGLYAVLTESITLRDGIPLSGSDAVEFGIFIVVIGFVILIFSLVAKIRNKEKRVSEELTSVKCPVCGRIRLGVKFGKYKCSSCGSRIGVGPRE